MESKRSLTYRLEITPLDKASKLDVVWLYSTKTDQTIDQLFEFKEKPAKIIDYTKINPTLWKVKVNATKPFMLSFARVMIHCGRQEYTGMV